MAAKEVNRLRGWKRTEDRFEENKARIKKDCLAVLSGMSAFSWEKMRPENRFEQMTPDEQMKFILSDEGADFRFKLSINVEGKKYPISVPGILKAAFLFFAGYVDAATSFAQNCGGGGSAPDQNWGRDKNEDDILWARRCLVFRPRCTL